MNSAYISKLIGKYVYENKLTYDDFDKIFGFLPRKEQYPIADTIQDVLLIELVDDLGERREKPPEIVNPARKIKMPNKLLIMMIRDGDERAKTDFLKKNSALVEKCAVNYHKKHEMALGIDDLIRFSEEGLIKFAQESNFDKESDFDSQVEEYIERFLEKNAAK